MEKNAAPDDTTQPRQYDESQLLYSGQPLRKQTINETGHSAQDNEQVPGELSGIVSGEQVQKAIAGTMPETPHSARRDPLGPRHAEPTPAKVDPSDGRSPTVPRTESPADLDPDTQGPNTNSPDYQLLHNDNSTPHYKDEVYRYAGEDVRDPASGEQPESWPKENNAY